MGCGTSSLPPKKDTRSNSHVTVAAQQRAEAAYRRQRMAQERAEETAIWRAEMEVERARMLKELSGEGSRRPSYCLELQESRKEAPDEFCREMREYLRQDYSVRSKNARNSLPVYLNPKCTINERRRSLRDPRESLELHSYDRTSLNGDKGYAKRKLSTTQQPDLESFRKIINRSTQISPMKENRQENRNVSGTTVDKSIEVVVQMVDESPRSEVSKVVNKNALVTKNLNVRVIPYGTVVDDSKSTDDEATRRCQDPIVNCEESNRSGLKQRLYDVNNENSDKQGKDASGPISRSNNTVIGGSLNAA